MLCFLGLRVEGLQGSRARVFHRGQGQEVPEVERCRLAISSTSVAHNSALKAKYPSPNKAIFSMSVGSRELQEVKGYLLSYQSKRYLIRRPWTRAKADTETPENAGQLPRRGKEKGSEEAPQEAEQGLTGA